jgi:hypothetical protein
MSSLVEVLENNDLMEKILINLRDQRWKLVMDDFIKNKIVKQMNTLYFYTKKI